MMKNWLFLIILMIESVMNAQELSLMTYNIRYATPNDGVNQWENRKDFLTAQLRFFAPDVFGIQEGLNRQVKYLDKELENYSYTGVGRDDGASAGEYSAIFYNKNKLEILDQGTFWLSETPDRVSKGWDAALERICSYALFRLRSSGQTFRVFNTHFDHRGVQAREQSAALIIRKIAEINKEEVPVFLLGDFNLNEKSEPIKVLSNQFMDSRAASKEVPFGPFGTFTGFSFTEPVQDRIDYIFCSPEGIIVKKYAVLTDSRDGRYPSDHFPVMIVAQLNAEKD